MSVFIQSYLYVYVYVPRAHAPMITRHNKIFFSFHLFISTQKEEAAFRLRNSKREGGKRSSRYKSNNEGSFLLP